MIGQIISHYRILEKLGEGGMGVVYKAQDTRLDRIVALKFLPHHLTANEAEKARFLQEAKAAAALNHPNVCSVIDIQEENEQQFIIMEYVEGSTLRRKLPLQKVDDAIQYAIQIGEALKAAHVKGIVHRDVKSENIMLTSDGRIKVMDFGLAKLKGSLKLTRTSSTVGTLAYMAPEQIQGGEVDARSDIFSFGIVLFEMLTGRTPFRGEHDAAMMYSIVNEEPDSILKHRPHASAEIERIIRRALEKDPEDRYQHVDDMVSELRREQKKSTRVVRPAASDPDVRPGISIGSAQQVASAGRKSSRKWLLIGAGTLSLAGIAVALFVFVGRKQAIDSLAVLPFANGTMDPNAEYLSEGITENITNRLSQLSKLRVVPRSLVAKYKGKEADPREVGKDLNVSAVLTGKVTQRGDALTIQTELIDIENLSQLWGEQYNKRLSDLMSVQDDIARTVTDRLQTQVSGEEERKLSPAQSVNPEAYQLYLKGRFHTTKRTIDGYRKGLQLYQEAVSIDPNFALAYSSIAEANLIGMTLEIPVREGVPKVKSNAIRALELDPGLAEAHTALAAVRGYFDYDFEGAEQSYRRAIEANPSYPTAHHWLAEFLINLGRFPEGIAEYQRATELDPASLPIASDVGYGFYLMRQYDRSIEVLKKTIETDPNFVRSHFYIMWPYLKKGMEQEAMDEYVRGLTANGDSATFIEAAKKRFADFGFKGVSQLRIERAEHNPKTLITPMLISDYIRVGNKDKALTCLEQAFEDRSNFCVAMHIDPTYDELRGEARFKALIAKMRYP